MDNDLLDGLYDMILQEAVPKLTEYNKAVKKAGDVQELLMKSMTEEQKKVLENYERLQFEYRRLEEIKMISLSFSLAYKIFEKGM